MNRLNNKDLKNKMTIKRKTLLIICVILVISAIFGIGVYAWRVPTGITPAASDYGFYDDENEDSLCSIPTKENYLEKEQSAMEDINDIKSDFDGKKVTEYVKSTEVEAWFESQLNKYSYAFCGRHYATIVGNDGDIGIATIDANHGYKYTVFNNVNFDESLNITTNDITDGGFHADISFPLTNSNSRCGLEHEEEVETVSNYVFKILKYQYDLKELNVDIENDLTQESRNIFILAGLYNDKPYNLSGNHPDDYYGSWVAQKSIWKDVGDKGPDYDTLIDDIYKAAKAIDIADDMQERDNNKAVVTWKEAEVGTTYDENTHTYKVGPFYMSSYDYAYSEYVVPYTGNDVATKAAALGKTSTYPELIMGIDYGEIVVTVDNGTKKTFEIDGNQVKITYLDQGNYTQIPPSASNYKYTTTPGYLDYCQALPADMTAKYPYPESTFYIEINNVEHQSFSETEELTGLALKAIRFDYRDLTQTSGEGSVAVVKGAKITWQAYNSWESGSLTQCWCDVNGGCDKYDSMDCYDIEYCSSENCSGHRYFSCDCTDEYCDDGHYYCKKLYWKSIKTDIVSTQPIVLIDHSYIKVDYEGKYYYPKVRMTNNIQIKKIVNSIKHESNGYITFGDEELAMGSAAPDTLISVRNSKESPYARYVMTDDQKKVEPTFAESGDLILYRVVVSNYSYKQVKVKVKDDKPDETTQMSRTQISIDNGATWTNESWISVAGYSQTHLWMRVRVEANNNDGKLYTNTATIITRNGLTKNDTNDVDFCRTDYNGRSGPVVNSAEIYDNDADSYLESFDYYKLNDYDASIDTYIDVYDYDEKTTDEGQVGAETNNKDILTYEKYTLKNRYDKNNVDKTGEDAREKLPYYDYTAGTFDPTSIVEMAHEQTSNIVSEEDKWNNPVEVEKGDTFEYALRISNNSQNYVTEPDDDGYLDHSNVNNNKVATEVRATEVKTTINDGLKFKQRNGKYVVTAKIYDKGEDSVGDIELTYGTDFTVTVSGQTMILKIVGDSAGRLLVIQPGSYMIYNIEVEVIESNMSLDRLEVTGEITELTNINHGFSSNNGVSCPTCGGTGVVNTYDKCKTCNGTGKTTIKVTCDKCSGTGSIKDNGTDCKICDGKGFIFTDSSMENEYNNLTFYKCDKCGYVYTYNPGNSQCKYYDTRSVCGGKTFTEKCSVCGYSVGSAACLNAHYKIVGTCPIHGQIQLNGNSSKYTCTEKDTCAKVNSIKLKYNLTFYCDTCEKTIIEENINDYHTTTTCSTCNNIANLQSCNSTTCLSCGWATSGYAGQCGNLDKTFVCKHALSGTGYLCTSCNAMHSFAYHKVYQCDKCDAVYTTKPAKCTSFAKIKRCTGTSYSRVSGSEILAYMNEGSLAKFIPYIKFCSCDNGKVYNETKCDKCNGTGKVDKEITCTACCGAGHDLNPSGTITCTTCGGNGRLSDSASESGTSGISRIVRNTSLNRNNGKNVNTDTYGISHTIDTDKDGNNEFSSDYVRLKDLVIAGYVYLDLDRNGLFDEEDVTEQEEAYYNINKNGGKEGVIVRLYSVVDGTETLVRTTRTDSRGRYTFSNYYDGSSLSWYSYNGENTYKANCYQAYINDNPYLRNANGYTSTTSQRIDKATNKDAYGNYTNASKIIDYYIEYEYDGVIYKADEVYAGNSNVASDGTYETEYEIDSNAYEFITTRDEFDSKYEYVSYDIAYEANDNKDETNQTTSNDTGATSYTSNNLNKNSNYSSARLTFDKTEHTSQLLENTQRVMTARSFITQQDNTNSAGYLDTSVTAIAKGQYINNTNKLFYINKVTDNKAVLESTSKDHVDLAKGNKRTTAHSEDPETNYLKFVNLGLELREDVDITLTKDVYKVKTTIDGESVEYTFNKNNGMNGEIGFDDNSTGNIVGDNEYLQDYIINKPYSLDLYESDYKARFEQYTSYVVQKYKGYEKSELNVEVTYRMTIANKSVTDDDDVNNSKNTQLGVRISELLDLYDINFRQLQFNNDETMSFNTAANTIQIMTKDADGYLVTSNLVVGEAWYYKLKSEADAEGITYVPDELYSLKTTTDEDNRGGIDLQYSSKGYVQDVNAGTIHDTEDFVLDNDNGTYVKVPLVISGKSNRNASGLNYSYKENDNDFKAQGYYTSYITGMENEIIYEGQDLDIFVKYVVDKDNLEIENTNTDYSNTSSKEEQFGFALDYDELIKQGYTDAELQSLGITPSSGEATSTVIVGSTSSTSGWTLQRSLKLFDRIYNGTSIIKAEGADVKGTNTARGQEGIGQINAYSVWYVSDTNKESNAKSSTKPAALVDMDANAGNIGNTYTSKVSTTGNIDTGFVKEIFNKKDSITETVYSQSASIRTPIFDNETRQEIYDQMKKAKTIVSCDDWDNASGDAKYEGLNSYYEDNTYKTGIEISASGTEWDSNDVYDEYGSGIVKLENIPSREISGTVWDDSRSQVNTYTYTDEDSNSTTYDQYIGNGVLSTADSKVDEAKKNDNVRYQYTDDGGTVHLVYDNSELQALQEISEDNDLLVRNVKAEIIEIVDVKTDDVCTVCNGAGCSACNNTGNEIRYYEQILTNVSWNQVQEIRSDSLGEYKLTGFIPGNYIVRFTYGDTILNPYDTDATYNEDGVKYTGAADQDAADFIYKYDDFASRDQSANKLTEKELLAEYIDMNYTGETKDALLNVYVYGTEYEQRHAGAAQSYLEGLGISTLTLNIDGTSINGTTKNDLTKRVIKDMQLFNGQDYKSTQYAYEMSDYQNNSTDDVSKVPNGINGTIDNYATGTTNGATNRSDEDIVLAALERPNLSDARDDEIRRLETNDYSEVMYNIKGEVLKGIANGSDLSESTITSDAGEELTVNYYDEDGNPKDNSLTESNTYEQLTELTAETHMYSETVQFTVKSEKLTYKQTNDESLKYINQLRKLAAKSSNSVEDNGLIYYKDLDEIEFDVVNNRDFKIENIDMGVEYRAETSITLLKEISDIELVSSSNELIFDIKLITKQNDDGTIYHTIDEENSIGADKVQFVTNDYTIDDYIGALEANEEVGQGLVYLAIDQELLQGATVVIQYRFTAANTSEVDLIANSLNSIRYRANNSTQALVDMYGESIIRDDEYTSNYTAFSVVLADVYTKDNKVRQGTDEFDTLKGVIDEESTTGASSNDLVNIYSGTNSIEKALNMSESKTYYRNRPKTMTKLEDDIDIGERWNDDDATEAYYGKYVGYSYYTGNGNAQVKDINDRDADGDTSEMINLDVVAELKFDKVIDYVDTDIDYADLENLPTEAVTALSTFEDYYRATNNVYGNTNLTTDYSSLVEAFTSDTNQSFTNYSNSEINQLYNYLFSINKNWSDIINNFSTAYTGRNIDKSLGNTKYVKYFFRSNPLTKLFTETETYYDKTSTTLDSANLGKLKDYVTENAVNSLAASDKYLVDLDDIGYKSIVVTVADSQTDDVDTSKYVNSENKNTAFSKFLKPESVSEDESYAVVYLPVARQLSSEIDSDDMQYENLAEVLQFTIPTGRRTNYSATVGNADIHEVFNQAENQGVDYEQFGSIEFVTAALEIDTSSTETITFTPPTGLTHKEQVKQEVLHKSLTTMEVAAIIIAVIILGSFTTKVIITKVKKRRYR